MYIKPKGNKISLVVRSCLVEFVGWLYYNPLVHASLCQEMKFANLNGLDIIVVECMHWGWIRSSVTHAINLCLRELFKK